MNDLLEKDTLKEGRFLLAFSGGPDSVYLLYRLSLFYQAELKDHISLSYIDYHDSPYVEEEERIVRYYVNRYQLTLHHNDAFYHKETDHNFEEWARDYRYRLFAKQIEKYGYRALLTAHQKTDAVETYLLQKKRNNLPLHYGLNTTTSIYTIPVIRPLLSFSKKELTEELIRLKLPFYDDITNLDQKKERNRLRTLLKEEELERYTSEIETENRRLDTLYSFFRNHPFGMEFSEYHSLCEEEQERYAFFLLDSLSIRKGREGLGKRIHDFLKKQEEGRLELSDTHSLYRRKEGFFLSLNLEKLSYSYKIGKEGQYETPFFRLEIKEKKDFLIPSFPITIRNYQSGDVIMSNLGIRSVEDFLKKQDVPKYLYPLYPVFVSHGKIFYVPFYQDIRKGKISLKLKYQKGIQS